MDISTELYGNDLAILKINKELSLEAMKQLKNTLESALKLGTAKTIILDKDTDLHFERSTHEMVNRRFSEIFGDI